MDLMFCLRSLEDLTKKSFKWWIHNDVEQSVNLFTWIKYVFFIWCRWLYKRFYVHVENNNRLFFFSWATKIQQHYRINLVISDTIRKLRNVLVFGPGLCTKCSYQQKQTCFCWEEKAYTMKYRSHMQYCTSILGHHRGVQPFPTAWGQSSFIIG